MIENCNKNSTTGYRYVNRTCGGKIQVKRRINGKWYSFGTYPTIEDAVPIARKVECLDIGNTKSINELSIQGINEGFKYRRTKIGEANSSYKGVLPRNSINKSRLVKETNSDLENSISISDVLDLIEAKGSKFDKVTADFYMKRIINIIRKINKMNNEK